MVLLNERLVIMNPRALNVDNPIRLEPLGAGVFRYTALTGGSVVGEEVRFLEENGEVGSDVRGRLVPRPCEGLVLRPTNSGTPVAAGRGAMRFGLPHSPMTLICGRTGLLEKTGIRACIVGSDCWPMYVMKPSEAPPP